MARSQLSLHFQEDERCGFCYEEWPCAGNDGAILSGVQAWEHNALMEAYRARRLQRRQRALQGNEILHRLGYPSHVRIPDDSTTVTLQIDTFVEILERIP